MALIFGASARAAKASEENAEVRGTTTPELSSEPSREEGATRDLIDLMEEDIGRARAQSVEAARAVAARIEEGVTLSQRVMEDADRLASSIAAASADVDAMASAFDDVSRAGTEITTEIRGAADLAEQATDAARRAGEGVAELAAATQRIEAVIGLIAKVAKQTNLLALNATIEAERAGVAGRGFAVVAQEVKALSTETQRATDEIGRTIAALQTAATRSGGTVGEVVTIIDQIRPRFQAVASAVDNQGLCIVRAAESADSVRGFVDAVSSRADAMRRDSAEAAAATRQVKDAALSLGDINTRTATRLTTLLRQTPGADRRRHDRFPVTLQTTLRAGATERRTETIDLSEGGVLLKDREAAAKGDRVTLDLSGIGRVEGRVVAVSGLGLHVAFSNLDREAETRLVARVGEVRREFQPLIDRAVTTAATIGQMLTTAIGRGEISAEALFDADYRPIAGTDPLQVETASLAFLERVLTPLQEEVVASDARMTFCAAVDRNGYLPVHNKVFSKPQRAGDPAWNAANSRNRRIFDDRTGLLAARNTRPFLIQAYDRDMGNGVVVLMKEVDAPIMVAGRHWGGFRTAYKF